jgi:hypothetical protein
MKQFLRIPARPLLAMLTVLPLLGATAARAADDDKIATDRPDFVESSEVVGKGRLQIETSIQGERNNEDGIRDKTYSTPTLLRIGVSDAVELRFESDGRIVAKSEDLASGASDTQRGYGDLSVGLKWHTRDGQGYTPSLGFLLHADLDSGSAAFRGNGVRPSLRMVAEWELPHDMSLGVMPGLAAETNDTGGRYASGIFGIVLGKEWNDRFRTFAEVSMPAIARAHNGGTEASADIGAAWLLNKNIQVDTALSRGLNRRTPDFTWTVGLSIRM